MEEEDLKKIINWFKSKGFKLLSREYKWDHLTRTLLIKHPELKRVLRIRRAPNKEHSSEIHPKDLIVDFSFENTAVSLNSEIFPAFLRLPDFKEKHALYFSKAGPNDSLLSFIEKCVLDNPAL